MTICKEQIRDGLRDCIEEIKLTDLAHWIMFNQDVFNVMMAVTRDE